MSSYQYRKSHCGDKTILRPSYLHNGISYTDKMISLYWIRAQVTSCQCMLASVAVMRYNNILILGWHYSGTNWPFNQKIRRSIAAYIASRRDLTRYWHCHKFPYYIPTKLACRQERNLNFEYRTRSISSMCCSKIFRPIYIKFLKH